MRKVFLIICACLISANAHSQCHPAYSDDDLLALKNKGFQLKSSDQLHDFMVGLPQCLSHPNPAIRDGVVYEAMNQLIRAKIIEPNTLHVVFADLISRLQSSPNTTPAHSINTAKSGTQSSTDSAKFKWESHPLNTPQADMPARHYKPHDDSFEKPFAAIALAEVVRADRIVPYLTDKQREEAVNTISAYMSSITDYRGFDDKEGWRHGVAHSADVMLQLAINKEINQSHIETMLDALELQISPSSHFYRYGESKRLALAFIYLVFRDEVDMASIKTRLNNLAASEPLKQWNEAYRSNLGLAHLHNVRTFLLELNVLSGVNKKEKFIAINEQVKELLRNTQ